MKSSERKRRPGEDQETPQPPRQPGSNEPEPDVPEPDDQIRELVKPVTAENAA